MPTVQAQAQARSQALAGIRFATLTPAVIVNIFACLASSLREGPMIVLLGRLRIPRGRLVVLLPGCLLKPGEHLVGRQAAISLSSTAAALRPKEAGCDVLRPPWSLCVIGTRPTVGRTGRWQPLQSLRRSCRPPRHRACHRPPHSAPWRDRRRQQRRWDRPGARALVILFRSRMRAGCCRPWRGSPLLLRRALTRAFAGRRCKGTTALKLRGPRLLPKPQPEALHVIKASAVCS